MIKCRYCAYQVRPWRRTRTGDSVSGWARLLCHVQYRHRKEFLDEQAKQQVRRSIIEQLTEQQVIFAPHKVVDP